MDLQGRIAIVTGAAGVIGRAIVKKLARCGAVVVVSDVNVEGGEAVATELGAPAVFERCDISDPDQAQSLVDAVVRRFGRLDIMVNNAGINTGINEDRVTADKYPVATWRRMIDVNLNGTFYCSKAAAAQMVSQGSGVIINITSAAAVVALRLQVGYVAAKAGILKMTEAMACELGPHGIRVNAVAPGSIPGEGTRDLFYGDEERAAKTISFIPQRRRGEAAEIADAVAFLASDEASYINGQNLAVDGGWTCGFNRDF